MQSPKKDEVLSRYVPIDRQHTSIGLSLFVFRMRVGWMTNNTLITAWVLSYTSPMCGVKIRTEEETDGRLSIQAEEGGVMSFSSSPSIDLMNLSSSFLDVLLLPL